MGAVKRIACLEGKNVVLAELFELAAHFCGRQAQLFEIITNLFNIARGPFSPRPNVSITEPLWKRRAFLPASFMQTGTRATTSRNTPRNHQSRYSSGLHRKCSKSVHPDI